MGEVTLIVHNLYVEGIGILWLLSKVTTEVCTISLHVNFI